MAGSGEVDRVEQVAGVLVPGDGRMRFCRSTLPGLAIGEWVALEGPHGLEPGKIVYPAGQVDFPASLSLSYSIVRLLADDELIQVNANAGRAQALIEPAARILARINSGAVLASTRLTLDGLTLICHSFGDVDDVPVAIAEELSAAVGLTVRVEWNAATPRAFGSLGRLPPNDVDASRAMRERLGIDVIEDTPFPHGWPRLGSEVRIPAGIGRLIAVSVRHNVATVRLESGELLQVPVAVLRPLAG